MHAVGMSRASSSPGVSSPNMAPGGADLGGVDGNDARNAHADGGSVGGSGAQEDATRGEAAVSMADLTPRTARTRTAVESTAKKRGRSPSVEAQDTDGESGASHQTSRARMSPSAAREQGQMDAPAPRADVDAGATETERETLPPPGERKAATAAPADDQAGSADEARHEPPGSPQEQAHLWDEFQGEVVEALNKVVGAARKYRKGPGAIGFDAEVVNGLIRWAERGCRLVQRAKHREQEGRPAWPEHTAPAEQAARRADQAQAGTGGTQQPREGLKAKATRTTATAHKHSTSSRKGSRRKTTTAAPGRQRERSASSTAAPTGAQAGATSASKHGATAPGGDRTNRSYAQAAGGRKRPKPAAGRRHASARTRPTTHARPEQAGTARSTPAAPQSANRVGRRTRVAISGLARDTSVPSIRQACSFYGAVRVVVASNTCDDVFVEFESYSRDLAAAVAAGCFRGLKGATVSWARLSRRARQERLRKSGKVTSVRCQATVPRAVKWTAVKELLRSKGFARTYVYFASNRVVVVDLPTRAEANRLRDALSVGIQAPRGRSQPGWSLKLQPDAQAHPAPQRRRQPREAEGRRDRRDYDDNYYRPLNKEEDRSQNEGQSQGGHA